MHFPFSRTPVLPRGKPRAWSLGLPAFLIFCLALPAAHPQQAPGGGNPVPIRRAKPPVTDPNPPSTASSAADEPFEPGDWAPSLLDGMLSSPNAAARDALLDAAFAAGPGIIPELEAALKDDRTAEFAAQSLAFIGGRQSLEILARLLSDPRDLGLKRFYYSALGEFRSPEATQELLDEVNRADQEDDRTVTESAIMALTVHSDASLIPALRQARVKVQDYVIRDDIENAIDVIQDRAKYLASPKAKNLNGSVDAAVRTYFAPALEFAPKLAPAAQPAAATAAAIHSAASGGQSSAGAKSRQPASAPAPPPVKVEVQRLTLSADRERALARVTFEVPTAVAYYTLVLQKEAGDWTVASVWLGAELEKPAPKAESKPKPADAN